MKSKKKKRFNRVIKLKIRKKLKNRKKIIFFKENKGIKIFSMALIFLIAIYIIYVISMDYSTPYSSNASVEYNVVPVYSKINGVIKKINTQDTEIVGKDKVLFEIEPDLYKISYDTAVSNKESTEKGLNVIDHQIEVAKAQVNKDLETLNIMSQEYEKYKLLYEKELIPQGQFDDIKLKYDSAKNDYEIANKQVAQLITERGNTGDNNDLIKASESQISKAKLDLSYTKVKAPISGEVDMQQLYSGNAVNVGTPLLYLIDKSELKVNVETKEKTINAIKNSEIILVIFDAYPNKIFHAKLSGITSVISSGYDKPGTIDDVEQIDNKVVRPQGYGKVTIEITDEIPKDYNIIGGGKASVIFVSKDSGVFMKNLAKIWIRAIQIFKYIQ